VSKHDLDHGDEASLDDVRDFGRKGAAPSAWRITWKAQRAGKTCDREALRALAMAEHASVIHSLLSSNELTVTVVRPRAPSETWNPDYQRWRDEGWDAWVVSREPVMP
jgi:hypothetical protein